MSNLTLLVSSREAKSNRASQDSNLVHNTVSADLVGIRTALPGLNHS